MPECSSPTDLTMTRRKQTAIRAKLKKLGIDPRGNKWHTLYFRWMAQP